MTVCFFFQHLSFYGYFEVFPKNLKDLTLLSSEG